jgi:hypothetical protein
MYRAVLRLLVPSIFVLVPAAAQAGEIFAGASCGPGGSILVDWTYYDTPPANDPSWVGYDVLRRTPGSCGSYVRLNAQIIPRTPGIDESFSYTDASPAQPALYEYLVQPVDAGHQPIAPPGCMVCEGQDFVTCPDLSVALTEGTLQDLGWALFVDPCPSSCYPGLYFTGPSADALRPFAGTGAAFRFFGNAYCGTVEGCGMEVASYQAIGACGSIPTEPSTWGKLKAGYR